MGRLTVLKQIARDLASQFGPDCEIVIHDLKTNDPEHSIVYIENGHVTGRGIGDGPSNAVFDVIRHNNKKGNDSTDEPTRPPVLAIAFNMSSVRLRIAGHTLRALECDAIIGPCARSMTPQKHLSFRCDTSITIPRS